MKNLNLLFGGNNVEYTICYDIKDNKIRLELSNMYKAMGLKRVQKSVFQGELKKSELKLLKIDTAAIVKSHSHHVLFIPQCASCKKKEIILTSETGDTSKNNNNKPEKNKPEKNKPEKNKTIKKSTSIDITDINSKFNEILNLKDWNNKIISIEIIYTKQKSSKKKFHLNEVNKVINNKGVICLKNDLDFI